MLQMNRSVAEERNSLPSLKSLISSAAVICVFTVLLIGLALGTISMFKSASSKAVDRLPTQVAPISAKPLEMQELFVNEKAQIKSAEEQAAEFTWK